MNYKEFKEIITFQISKLTEQRCIAFGLSICHHLLPEYQTFYDQNNWGDPKKLKEAVAFCGNIKNGVTDQKILADLIAQVDAIIPDTEDFGDYSGSYALNSGASVFELLKYFVDKDKSHIVSISAYMTDTVDFKIAEKNPELSTEEVDKHADIVNEYYRQIALTR